MVDAGPGASRTPSSTGLLQISTSSCAHRSHIDRTIDDMDARDTSTMILTHPIPPSMSDSVSSLDHILSCLRIRIIMYARYAFGNLSAPLLDLLTWRNATIYAFSVCDCLF